MKNMKELDLHTMEQVTGGVFRTINTGVPDLKAAIRKEACKSSRQIAALPNGTVIDTVTDQTVFDPESGRNFVQITFTDINGKKSVGWVAASIVGLPR